jgi:hypothetical protein
MLAAASFVVGLVCGVYLGFRFEQSRNVAERTLAFGQAVKALEIARTSGNDANYEEALWRHIAHLQIDENSAQPQLNEKGFAVDYALAYARLSMIAGKRGSESESSRLLQKAESFCPRIGWPECSGRSILAFAKQVESNRSSKSGLDR